MAKKEEKTLEIKIRLWTNEIAQKKGTIEPKHCWDAGSIGIS